MKYLISILLMAGLLLPFPTQAQEPFLKKVKRKVEQRKNRKIDKEIDKGLDKVEEATEEAVKKDKKKKRKDQESSSSSDDSAASTTEGAAIPADGNTETLNEPVVADQPNIPVIKNQKQGGQEPVPFPDADFSNGPTIEPGEMLKGIYGTKSGTLITNMHTVNQAGINIYQQDTLFFDTYGKRLARRQAQEQHVTMMGFNQKQSSRNHSITLGDTVYGWDPGKRTGTKMENPAIPFYEGMSEKETEKFAQDMEQNMNTTHKRLGTQYILDKPCEIYEYTTLTQDGKVMMISRMWFWKGLVLKSLSRGMGSEIEQIATLVKDHVTHPQSTFQVPADITFNTFSLEGWQRN